MDLQDFSSNPVGLKVKLTYPEIKKHPSHPDLPRMSNEAMVEKAYQLMGAIERCGASPELTAAVILADELYQHLKKPITA